MTLKIRSRSFLYHRVHWLNGVTQNLEELLKNAHQALSNTADRTFDYAHGEIQGLSIEPRQDGVFFHVAFYVPKQPISLVPAPSQEKEKETKEQIPPANHDFMEGDVFFLVSGNHIIICPSEVRESVALSYINDVLRKMKQEHLLLNFSIDSVANVDKVALLKQEGVKKILLNTTLYEASVHYLETKKSTALLSGVKDFLQIFSKDSEEIKEKENLSVKVEISFDSRKKGGEVGHKRMLEVASKLIDDKTDKGFTIITGKNKALTSDEINLSYKVNLPAEGNSVGKEATWNELGTYLKKLKQSGMLEQ